MQKTLEKESKGLIKLDTSKLKLTKAQIEAEMARIEKYENSDKAAKPNKGGKNGKSGNKKSPKSINYVV